MNAATTTTTAAIAAGSVEVVLEDLRCPGCGEDVDAAPPAYWAVRDGFPVAIFSHRDRSPLCRDRAGRIVEPFEVAR